MDIENNLKIQGYKGDGNFQFQTFIYILKYYGRLYSSIINFKICCIYQNTKAL